ncbi:macrophage migration inhibitory factor family protein [Desulfovibrio sp. X2]|uniref:phenylpyruvate tautomerase MIF-related protein n=1 Tax=Desulfovibrio sp. X2 TaxID=941449 RepID=UPI000358E1C0|nr:phenylpyruvate tautomerase MIF-related protein [Desulfovibrio sp. X2]EPR42843.1 macrophage migration inhibitory factor family protein [Desulfovibrio sp. X2]
MPCLKIETNVELDAAKARTLALKLANEAATAIGKPVERILTIVEPGLALTYRGTDAPAAWVEVKSIGLTADECPALAAWLGEFVERELGVSANRALIEFKPLSAELTGVNKGTVAKPA